MGGMAMGKKAGRIKLGDMCCRSIRQSWMWLCLSLISAWTLLNMGGINLKGNRDITTVTLSSFFRAVNHHFTIMQIGRGKYRAQIENWKENKEVKTTDHHRYGYQFGHAD